MGRITKRADWRAVAAPLVFVAGALIGSCDDGATDERQGTQTAGSSGAGTDAPFGAGGSWIFVDDASIGGSGSGTSGPDSAPDVGPQPLVECGDAGDATSSNTFDSSAEAIDECSPPPSRCVDARLLLYFQNGRCVDGRCVWDQKLFDCGGYCRNGGCFGNMTFAASQ
jgi:hypothetical protein